MSEIKDGGPAFPCQQAMNPDGKWNDTFEPGMSLRQYAAIHLCVPDSGLDWLDEMIEKARKDRLLGCVLQGELACQNTQPEGFGRWSGNGSEKLLAKDCHRFVDAVMEREKADA
jgi:hypothetical protein